MTGETTRPVGTTIGEDGVPVAQTITSPTDDKVRAQCKTLPHTVVPIVFVPGIMGSNLRDKQTKKNIWGLNSVIGMLFQWGFRSSGTRQSKLDPGNAEVDPGGAFPGKSATVPNAAVAKDRGWGTVAKMSYGDFLRWLDNSLNSDFCNSIVQGDDKSPWADFQDKDFSKEWGAEKSFTSLTDAESNQAWNNFYCPVHAVGYNWLQSNGQSGKDLAAKISEIIKTWADYEVGGQKPYKCEQVILVSHSMGGLVSRAATHPSYGACASSVTGIVHGEQPANGAAAAYHHCRSGYGGMTGIVLGRNAEQVTAVFASSPGAMELLPNANYPKSWLKAKDTSGAQPALQLPNSDPYEEIYAKKDPWWRLVDPAFIDPAGTYKKSGTDPWVAYATNLAEVGAFHQGLGTFYHDPTYVHYGASTGKYSAWGDLVWQSSTSISVGQDALLAAMPSDGSNPVTVLGMKFEIVDPQSVGYLQPGDGTVPVCSGEAPNLQGGGSVKQSFRMQGFEHQDAYNNELVRNATLWGIGKLLQQAKVL
ncbi:esterase/lipase family protein [Dyella acidiphila]|uniref:GPI inositol-deacylase PGAP1-like alpha/beta domain-containing protein n=1 Tax=Dyella acidiphila TaxID=2775866 RepID=A0ABR9GAN5_9GAMM|nr:hypothetical protein [Dyella acidiphila]MBE1161089.1 hypothetical protein [Dyella acidiphila]